MSEKQYASRPPTICCAPFIMYQYVTRAVCSSRRYQVDERTTKAGWHTDSKSPSSVRTVTKPAKDVQAAVQASTVPQAMMEKERYLAMGTRAISQFCGYSTTRMVM